MLSICTIRLKGIFEEHVEPLRHRLVNGENAYKNWLKELNQHDLKRIVDQIADTNASGPHIQGYIQLVKDNESIGVCAKCRWSYGCERCSYTHALRYVCRWARPAAWYMKVAENAVLGISRKCM